MDVGAGTGISARLLAARGARVIALEPGEAMRGAAGPRAGIRWIAARAEATGLRSACADVILSAQSFHWLYDTEVFTSTVTRPPSAAATPSA